MTDSARVEVMPNRDGKETDDFFGVLAEQIRAEDQIRALLDECLKPAIGARTRPLKNQFAVFSGLTRNLRP